MTVYLPKDCRTYYMNFTWRGIRVNETTHQTRKDDALIVEGQRRLKLRRQAAGIATFDPADTPKFQDWAEVYAAHQARHTGRPDVAARTLAILLDFFGRPPRKPKAAPTGTNTRHVSPPHHDLRLGDLIADPGWVTRFEDWVSARGVSGSTRNSYLSALNGLYKLAMRPEWRGQTKVTENPFATVSRSATNGRVLALDLATLRAWMTAAPQHVKDAMAIAALAPKLRLQSILALEWAVHFDAGLTKITIEQHKTRRRTGLPQVTPIDPQLRLILEDIQARAVSLRARAKKRLPDLDRYVITWRGKKVGSIKRGTKAAAEAAGLTWGVSSGVTFHTVRHTIATLLAEIGVAERLRMELLGHSEIRTTQKYTHLAAASQVTPHAQLSAALPLSDVVVAASREPSQVAGEGSQKSRKSPRTRKARSASTPRRIA